MQYDKLISAAVKAREKAYAPYSEFKVGAAVLTDNNQIFSGCNIENASYGATNCAERTAIFKAVSEGHRKIKAVAVIGDTESYTFPCGICRQVISEFAASRNIDILIVKNEKDYLIKTLEELLPGAFSRENFSKHKREDICINQDL